MDAARERDRRGMDRTLYFRRDLGAYCVESAGRSFGADGNRNTFYIERDHECSVELGILL